MMGAKSGSNCERTSFSEMKSFPVPHACADISAFAAMQVTTFKVRTVRSKDGVYTNPVSTWLHGTDNDLDSIAGTHQELLQKALSQANTSGLPLSPGSTSNTGGHHLL